MSASAAQASGAPLFVAPVTVRWRDLDAFNHVNNANYLTYIEEARLQWLMHVGDWFDDAAAPVLAASELNYRIPITWPTDIRVELRCERVGNSSLTLAYRIVDAVDATRVFRDEPVHRQTGGVARLCAHGRRRGACRSCRKSLKRAVDHRA
jgi:acyl-CoA thioester hydrolase